MIHADRTQQQVPLCDTLSYLTLPNDDINVGVIHADRVNRAIVKQLYVSLEEHC